MHINNNQAFGRFRSWFMPVHRGELKLFLPLLLIFCFICFNYNILRAAKDSLVLTAPSSGAEIIPFMKVWVILPMALLMTALFTRLSNRYSTEKIFYLMVGFFLAFFVLFGVVLFPLKDVLHPHQFANYLEQILPLGFKGFVAMIRNWTYTTFYIMSELWGTTIMSVLFWGFANEILNVQIAKRFYVLILIGGNISAICAGSLGKAISDFSGLSRSSEEAWHHSLLLLIGVVIFGGFAIMGIFRWLQVSFLTNPQYNTSSIYQQDTPSVKMGLRNNFKYLMSSKYLLCIAAIVLTYNTCINLTEVTWKSQILNLCPGPNEFNGYMNQVTMWVGITATVISIISGFIMHRFSWTFNAMIPPVLTLLSGSVFFLFLIFKDQSIGVAIANFFGTSPYIIGVLFGSIQQCITRGSKYTIFDATKEIAFIPLDKESKLKGKAAIDGVGSRLGKSGSALIYQMLLMIFGTISGAIPYVGAILIIIIIAWIIAVCVLGKQFQILTHDQRLKSLEENSLKLSSESQQKASS